MEKQVQSSVPIFGAVLAAGIAVYLGYREGLKTNQPVELPYDTGGSHGTDLRTLQIIADRIYKGDTGFNFPVWGEHDEEAYRAALSLSNTDFTELYNVFNAKYQSDLSETMTRLISDQWAADDSTYGVLRHTMLDRLASLNLP